MIVNTPETKYFVDDYDFTFVTGMMMPVTVNTAAGDTIQGHADIIEINLTAKPSMNDPSKMLPAETITVYRRHLAATQQRRREVTELAPEQKHEWMNTLKELSKTVQ